MIIKYKKYAPIIDFTFERKKKKTWRVNSGFDMQKHPLTIRCNNSW